MKKILSILLVSAMILSILSFAGCSAGQSTLKLGLGLHTAVSATDATEDKAGQGQITITAAAVLVDADGKIVKAFIDCADNKVGYTADGKAVSSEFQTKYEAGAAYNMVAYGGAVKEWFEQADAFCALIVGKTADEVMALVAEGGKGTDAVISAGCTITVSEFASAVVDAIGNAADSSATAADTLKLGIYTGQTIADATEDKAGSNKTETSIFAAAVDASGKVTAASSDCVDVSFTFDQAGKSTFDTTKEVLSKKEQGDSYGMVAYGGAAKEWYAQAAAFDAACVGKTAAEIAGLTGNADLQAAGCTIDVTSLTKAAAKIG